MSKVDRFELNYVLQFDEDGEGRFFILLWMTEANLLRFRR